MPRLGLRELLVVAMIVGGTGLVPWPALAAGPDFSLSASPPSVSVGATQTATTTIAAAPVDGFSGPVALSVNGLPAGVTATLAPAPSGTTILLRLSASSSVTSGVTTITVVGTGGGITHTLGIRLSVAGFVSDFAIFANPGSLTVAAGSSASSTIVATPQTGFSGLPAFAASGLPAGVTASFGPTTPAGGGSRAALTLTAAGTAPAGSARVVITGTAGSARATATIVLTVSRPAGPAW
jgi:hypothetical protein